MNGVRIGFIGHGRVARGLSLALSRCGYAIVGVASRARAGRRFPSAADVRRSRGGGARPRGLRNRGRGGASRSPACCARTAYHAGAHYAAAFMCTLMAEGVEVWRRIGIAPDDALRALLSLLRGATDAVAHSGPAHAMAGAVARGDLDTVKRHVEALGRIDPKLRELYCTRAALSAA